MRIAIVTEYYYPTLGGVQEHVFHFAREARRQGHSATVITSHVRDLAPAPLLEEPEVVRLGRSLCVDSNGSIGRITAGASLGRDLEKLLVPERFDVVHVHAPLAPVLPMLAIRRTRLPLVATYHTNFTRSRLLSTFRGACQAIVDRLDANIAVSEVCVKAIEPYVHGRFRIVPNGVDCRWFASGQRPIRDRARRLLFVGRLEIRSGLDRLLRAWPLIEGRAGLRLTVIGDGPLRRDFEALARELSVPAEFLGAVRERRPDYYAAADLLICPTTIASFGITLLEGMAAGLPIVASDIDGFREILTHGQEGLLVDTALPQRLAGAISELLASPERRREMGEAGRATAQGYDWPKVTQRIFDVYRSIGVRA